MLNSVIYLYYIYYNSVVYIFVYIFAPIKIYDMIDLEKTFKEYGINITDLASKMNVNRQTIYYYIKQGDKNSVSQLQKIAEAANIPLSKIMGIIEDAPLCPYCGKPIRIKIEKAE